LFAVTNENYYSMFWMSVHFLPISLKKYSVYSLF
jgi:hypothetical protein